MKLDHELLQKTTSDVGSIPLIDDFANSQRNFRKATTEKLAVGLDFPCYPQLQGTKESPMNMYLQFLAPLAKEGRGLSICGEEIHLEEEIDLPDRPVGVERARYFADFLSKNQIGDHLIAPKACVTGPFTLASSIDREDIFESGISKKEVILKLSELVSTSCIELERLGFQLINVDEPILSVILGDDDKILKKFFGYGKDFIVETLDKVFKTIKVYTGTHVCGTVTPLVKRVLLESRVDIVDHEFCSFPRNLQAYTKRELESRDKLLAFGCVSTTDPTVEDVETIKHRIRQGLEHFGENIMIKPDCGFGGFLGAPSAYELSMGKLRNMVQARKTLKE